MPRFLATLLLLSLQIAPFRPAAPIQYRFSFPEPQHHWMQVDVSFSDLEPRPLQLRMSRSSPGRYAAHDFAKNVYDVRAYSADGRELEVLRPDPSGWDVVNHGGQVRVVYKVFGDRVDGTYLAVDTTHAHINMPAAIMWARGLDDRPAVLTFTQPPGQRWQVATQLHAASGGLEFTAPNLQYLMDSPVEFGPVAMQQFSVDSRTFRFALHDASGGPAPGAFIADVEKIVREQGAIFGEYPAYEPGHYTFLADYLPYASGDGMEHRNSTVMTSTRSIAIDRLALLDTVAHEFFHNWNVERIRPRSLEPFDFERENMSGELWLAEGFTQYYGPLTLSRAGLADLGFTAATFGRLVEAVALSPAHLVRSAEEMSRMAPFTDGGRPIDRTNWPDTVISYYSFGGAIALALDLSLRERSNGKTTLDDYMRAMWRVHGKPGGSREGYVDRPFTAIDAEARLAEAAGDAAFARDFFARYIRGRELPDYARLLSRAALVLRKQNPGRAWWGDVRFEARDGAVRLAAAPASGSPLYRAGLDVGDTLTQIDGTRMDSPDDVGTALGMRKAGDTLTVTFRDRGGASRTAALALVEDPALELVPVESTGGAPTPAQRVFRESWLGPSR